MLFRSDLFPCVIINSDKCFLLCLTLPVLSQYWPFHSACTVAQRVLCPHGAGNICTANCNVFSQSVCVCVPVCVCVWGGCENECLFQPVFFTFLPWDVHDRQVEHIRYVQLALSFPLSLSLSFSLSLSLYLSLCLSLSFSLFILFFVCSTPLEIPVEIGTLCV